MKNIRIIPTLPENKRMQNFLRARGIECVPKYIRTGALKGCWRLYNPDEPWSLSLAEQLNALGFSGTQGKPLGSYDGNGGIFSTFVRGHDELLQAPEVAADYDPTVECRGECAGCQIPKEEMPCQYERPYHVQWTYKRHESGMVEVLEENRVIVFWAAPKHIPERADRHEGLAKMICNDHNAQI